jgi:uncharacterized protein involved in exopolysaccharide biosynthesis
VTTDSEPQRLQFLDLLRIVAKRRWAIVIPAGLGVLAAVLFSLLTPPVWEVDAIVVPSKFRVQTEQGGFEEVVVTEPKQIASQINQQSYRALIAAELNLDLKTFPRIRAENLIGTKLVRTSLRVRDVEQGKAILRSLFAHLKAELDAVTNVELQAIETERTSKQNAVKDLENEIKTLENEVRRKANELKLKDIEIQSREIEKDRLRKEIEAGQNKLKISEARVAAIMEEMKAVKGRVDDLDQQLKKVIAENKEDTAAVSLLLYSNEVQQNLRYYNTLDEKLSIERVAQENVRLDIQGNQDDIRQIDTQIGQAATGKEMIRIETNSVYNEIEKLKNRINTLQSETSFLENKKTRIDYARLVKEPTPSLRPVAPRLLLNIVLAAVCGLLVFIGLACVIEYVEGNGSFRGPRP